MRFDKYESTGNDFIIANTAQLEKDGFEITRENVSALAIKICDRHFGIGADGFLLLDDSKVDREGFGSYQYDPKAHVRFYGTNSDGSQFEMTGNGFRCFAQYAMDNGYGLTDTPGAKKVSAETLAGTKSALLSSKDGKNFGVVDMGELIFEPEKIPFTDSDPLDVPITLLGKQREAIAINTGIPHWVVVLDSQEELDSPELAKEGLDARFDSRFPNNTNVSVAVIETSNKVTARIFERGAAETLSCGTGAAAIAGALNKIGKLGIDVTVSLLGGDLNVHLGKTAQLSGPVNFIASCDFKY